MNCRIAVNRSKMDHSSIMKASHIVKHIITLSADHYALAAQNPSPDDASQRCSENSIPSTLCALFAWSSSTKAHSKNKTINHIVMVASKNYSANHIRTRNKQWRTHTHNQTVKLRMRKNVACQIINNTERSAFGDTTNRSLRNKLFDACLQRNEIWI